MAEDVRAHRRLTTGLLGTPHLLRALSRFGYLEAAYELLNRQEFPSWLYPVTRGATTVRERWDAIRPDGTLADPQRNSMNHYGLGAVGEWMYRTMAGINPDAAYPGYRHSIIEPQPGGGFTRVKGSLETPYGRIRSEWAIAHGQFDLRVEIPPNTYATIRLPHSNTIDVGSGVHRFHYPWRSVQ